MTSTATRAAATHQGQLLARLSDHTDLPVNGHTVPGPAHNSSSGRSYTSTNTRHEQPTQQIMICKCKEAKLEAICIMLFPAAGISASESVLPYCLNSGGCTEKMLLKKKSENKFHQDTTEIQHVCFARVRRECVKIKKKVFLNQRFVQVQKEKCLMSKELMILFIVKESTFAIFCVLHRIC